VLLHWLFFVGTGLDLGWMPGLLWAGCRACFGLVLGCAGRGYCLREIFEFRQ